VQKTYKYCIRIILNINLYIFLMMQTRFKQLDKDVCCDHVAIVTKSWKVISKILNGQKTIESRWYKARFAPWDRIKSGDVVYFKNSGEEVTAKAKVKKVVQYDGLDKQKIQQILTKYQEGLCIKSPQCTDFYEGKKYCILIFLSDPVKLKTSFAIDKTGYGSGCAWMCVGDIDDVKASK
jgi:ASC-1-like (ASCH) protein